ncbi:MAG: VOC family protein [Caulobacterales bacterium]|nr:VOC family protein [Caulobacterales bacterium]
MTDTLASAPLVPKTAKERGKIAPAKLAHIVLRTSRYQEMIAWYQTVLEAEIVLGTPVVTFMTYDDEHHRVAIANMPGLEPRPPQTTGMEHCAFTYATLDDLFATYERLAGQGVKPFWTINHGGTLSLYYRDPDHNQLELQVDVFDSNEALTAWFKDSDFDVNPVGVKVDLDDLIARYRAGEDRATLLARPRIHPSEVPAQFP